MSYRTILVALRTAEEVGRLIETAAAFGDEKSHVIVAHSESEPPIYASPDGIAAAEYYARLAEDSKQRLAELRKATAAASRKVGIETEWRGSIAPANDELGIALTSAYCADLVVAGQADPELGMFSHSERLLFETGRPVLFVPFGSKAAKPPKTVLVAWKESRESARALFEALPLLKKAKTVEVILVDPRGGPDQGTSHAGDAVAATLSRHGIKVDVQIAPDGGMPAGTVIQDRAAELGADMVVMGAYGHSRLREMILGGVTRQMLQLMKVPTFMAH
jgi:nucleotide-binding universal stress UspA family protein